MSFLDQPYIYPLHPAHQARSRFAQLIETAQSATTRAETLDIAIIGDSTMTESGGAGRYAMSFLKTKLAQVCGGLAGSSLTGVRSANEYAFVRSLQLGASASTFPASHFPPGLGGLNSMTALSDSSSATGAPYLLRNPAPSFRADTRRINAGQQLFPEQSHKLELYLSKRLNSAENLVIRHRPTDKALSAFESVESSQVINVTGLNESASEVDLIRVTSQDFTATAAKPYSQFQIATDDTVNPGTVEQIFLACGRLLNPNPRGVIIDSLSAGGYRSQTWFGRANGAIGSPLHEDAARYVAQLRHKIIVVMLGANDHYNSYSVADQRDDVFNTIPGANHRGVLGEIFAEQDSLGIEKPLVILASTPYRAPSVGESDYAAKLAIHEQQAESNQILADRLIDAGVDAIAFNTHRWTYELGFNESVDNHLTLNYRGVYDDSGVSYVVGDSYDDANGDRWECIADHTSAANKAPTADFINNQNRFHTPNKIHLADQVHWSIDGSELVGDAITWLFSQHASGTPRSVSQASVEAIATAVDQSPLQQAIANNTANL